MSASRISKILIALTLLVSAIVAYTLSSHREFISDDLNYRYICDDTLLEDPHTIRPIQNFSDIIESQRWHYANVNGRAPVHVLVQLFAGILGYKIFGIVNAIIFLLFIYGLMLLIFNEAQRQNPWNWLILSLSLFYLFPPGLNTAQGPWFGIAFGINYLWVGALFCWVILLVKRLQSHRRNNNKYVYYAAFAIIGFLLGWSHEGFALPLLGGLLLFMFKDKNSRKPEIIIITVGLLIGACLLSFAPGTLGRISKETNVGSAYMLITLIETYISSWPFWICIAVAIISLCAKRFSFKEFYNNNFLLLAIWFCSFAMSLLAHTGPHSICCLNLLSLIIALRMIIAGEHNLQQTPSGRTLLLFAIVLTLFITHQVFIYKANDRRIDVLHRASEQFLKSPDGIFVFEMPEEPCWINAYTDHYFMGFDPIAKVATFSHFVGNKNNIPIQLSAQDFQNIIVNPDSFFLHAEKMPGSADLYVGDRLYIGKTVPDADSAYGLASFDGDSFKQSLPFIRRVAYSLLGNKKEPKALKSYVLHTRNGDFFVCEKILSTPSRIDLIE